MSSRINSNKCDDEFDPLSARFAEDPYSAYTALRAAEGLQYYEPYDMWLVSRYQDVTRIVMDRKLVRSPIGVFSPQEIEELNRRDNWHEMPYHSRFVQFSLLDSDGEVHDRLRRHVFKLFTPAMIRRLRDTVQGFVDKLIDGLIERSEIDFVEDLAAAVPGYVIGSLIGVPADDCQQLRIWSERVVQYFDIDRTDERKQLAETTTYEFYRYLDRLKKQKQRQPSHDLMTQLIEIERDGGLNEDEFISTCMLIVMAGHGSTLDVLGSGLHALLRFPAELNRLRANPDLINSAVQEMFRFESPLPFFHRYAAEDCEVSGQKFPKRTRFGLLYGSANRDPEAFELPEHFDIGRNPNRHLAFGGGAHFCLGNHLARLNMDIVFSTLLRRFSDISIVVEPEYKSGLSVRGPKSLQVALTPA